MRIVKLNEESRKNILENLLKRSPSSYGEFESRVNAIIERIRREGDTALFEMTRQFDHAEITAETVEVTKEQIE